MKFSNSLVILLFLTLYSCSDNKKDLCGTYVSENPSKSQKIIDYVTNSSSLYGTHLKISQDSTFNLENCSQKINGNWKISNDTLLLYCLKKEFVIDSLNFSEQYKKYLECDTKPSFYLIKDNKLEFRTTSKKSVLYETLIKKED